MPGDPPKQIDELVGRVNTDTDDVSIARMVAPPGWEEPAQTPTFDEYTVVLRGLVRVEHDGGIVDVHAGEAIVTRVGERVRYSTLDEGAEYIAVACRRSRPRQPTGTSERRALGRPARCLQRRFRTF